MRLALVLLSIFLSLEGFVAILTGLGMIIAREEVYGLMKKEFERALQEFNSTHILSPEFFERVYDFISIFALTIGIAHLITSLGILLLKKWARIAAIALLGYQLVYSSSVIIFDVSSILFVIVSALFIWYLFRKDVKEIFSGKKMSIEEKILGKKI
jgi:hypothetical protein